MFLNLPEPREIQAILIDPDRSRAEMFAMALGPREVTLTQTFGQIENAMSAAPEVGLAICHADVDRPNGDEFTQLRQGLGVAVLVLVERAEPHEVEALMAEGADQVIALGTQPDRLSFGIAAALGGQAARATTEAELNQCQHDLAEARRVYQAKAILIARHNLTEVDAHRRIQKLSMERNIPIADMARLIIDAESLLC